MKQIRHLLLAALGASQVCVLHVFDVSAFHLLPPGVVLSQSTLRRIAEEGHINSMVREAVKGVPNKPWISVIGAAWAHVERLTLEAFVDKIETLPEGQNKLALQLVEALVIGDDAARESRVE